jgi:hypothetical protein
MPVEKLVVSYEETVIYLLDGKIHNKEGPAVIYPDGTREWWINGKRHNINGPAIYNNNTGFSLKIRNGKVDPVNYIWTENNDRQVVVVDHIDVRNSVMRIKPILEKIKVIDSYRIDQKGDKLNYYYKGMLHRCSQNTVSGEGPAEMWDSGSEIWYMYGVKHRENGHAVKDVVSNQTIWYYFGLIHNDTSRAKIKYSKNYRYCESAWYKYGIVHRDNGAAYTKAKLRSENITIIQKSYYSNGHLHRDDGPAVIRREGYKEHMWWYQDGKMHNLRGPSYKGDTDCWVIDGKTFSEDKHKKIVNIVYKFLFLLRRRNRQKKAIEIYDNTKFCRDVSSIISEYIF